MENIRTPFIEFAGKVIALFLMLMMFLFPNNPGMIAFRQSIENNVNTCAPVIVEAIKNRDVETMKSLMCANIKRNVKNLDKEIQEMFDAIDGKILEVTWTHGFSSYTENDDSDGRKISQMDVRFPIKTSKQDYYITLMWEDVNNFKPEETKIRAIALATDTMPPVFLKNIKATDGIGKWHE